MSSVVPSGRCWTVGALACLSLLPSGCSSDSGEEALLAEGVSWELAELRRSTLSDVLYEYSLQVPESREEPILGSVRVQLKRNDPLDHPLIFDFLNPQDRVSQVEVNGTEVIFETVHDHLVVPIPADAPQDSLQIIVNFTAGDESLNRDDEFLYALFVPERARYSVPLFDQPNLKARFALFLDLPLGWTAMANGQLIREGSEGTRKFFQFSPSDPLPTYLFTFAAGKFQKITRTRGGRVMEFMHRETDTEKLERNLDALFDLHLTALDWLEEYTGIEYPFKKFGFVAIPAFQYGGMEHPGAIFYRDRSLFLEETATQAQFLGRASLIAHETAHMWFGDYVTMNWFDDVWTKEVFANFMAAKIVHPSFPELDHELRFLLAHHASAYGVDRTEGANPIRQPLENLREAGTLYGSIIYQKAPVVMRQLEELIGEEPFRAGIQRYLAENGYGNATWPTLIDILDPMVPEDLRAWSEVWVEEPERPTVWVDWEGGQEGSLESLTLHQEDPRGQGRIWPQPLGLALGYGERVERIPVRFLDESMEVEEAAGMPVPDFILPDGWGQGYGLFLLDEASRSFLLEHLPTIQDPVVRGAGWMALWDGVLEGDVGVEDFLELSLESVPLEREEQILQRVLGNLATVYWNLITPEERLAWAPRVEEILWEGVMEAESMSRRSTLFRSFRSLALTPKSVGILEEVWGKELEVPGLNLSETDYTSLASALAIREVESWEEILAVQSQEIQNPDRKAQFEFVRRSLDADPAVREAFFEDLRDPSNREKEPWVLAGLGNLNHPLRRDHAQRFILPSLELLEEIQRTGDIFFPARWVGSALGNHTAPEAAAQVREFLQARPDFPYRLELKILQAADPLFRAVEIQG
jgi:aminopeptidase N